MDPGGGVVNFRAPFIEVDGGSEDIVSVDVIIVLFDVVSVLVINLDLSRLGPLQLDGMFRKESRGFDLMIRTKQPLPDPLRLELTALFGTSTSAMGLKGGLSFQVVKRFADPLGDTGHKSGLWA